MALRLLIFLVGMIVVPFGYAQIEATEFKSISNLRFEGNTSGSKLGKKSNVGNDYDVVYHKLSLYIDPRQRPMHGSVLTYFKPFTSSFSEVRFDLTDSLQVDSVIYHGAKRTYTHLENELRIDLGSVVNQGQLDSITVYYSGDPTNNPQRSYERESGRAMSSSPLIWTLSQPYGARDWWPCKQGLTDKIDSLDMYVTVPKGNKAAGIGSLESVTEPTDSQLTYHWKHRYPVATYLVATAVTDYVEFTDWVRFSDGDSLAILNYVFPESRPFMEEPVKQTIPIMKLFDSLIGEYPFSDEKYGHAEFLRGGGMEHQTMSFMGSWSFGLIAHELAHQWFGDQITCNTWSDLWLNEGFATYFTLVAREALQDEATWRSVQLASQERALREPTESVFVIDTIDRERLFSSHLTYNKGAQLLRMLHWQMGDSLFYLALRNYLNDPDLYYGFAGTADLQHHLEAVSGKDFSTFFDQWFYGVGNPHYIVNWEQRGSQTEVSLRQTTNSSTNFFRMPVELAFVGSNQTSTITIDASQNDTSFIVHTPFAIDSMSFDPQLWVLATHEVHNRSDYSSDVILYPNPAGNQITVSALRSNYTSYRIYDVLGRTLVHLDLPASDGVFVDINLDGFMNGLYFLELRGKDTKSVSRFVKK